jgi:hypothetical protein
VCSRDGFEKLKLLATHIRNIHRVRYPNEFFCPECRCTFTKALDTAEHLLREHSLEEDFTRYYIIKGSEEKFKTPKQLAHSL